MEERVSGLRYENDGESLVSGRMVTLCAYAVLSTISLGSSFDKQRNWRAGSQPFITCSLFSKGKVSNGSCHSDNYSHACILFMILPLTKELEMLNTLQLIRSF